MAWKSDAVVAWGLFLFFLIAYAAALSNHLTGDSIWYAHDIFMPGEQYFHPHHLLYNPLMRLLLAPFTLIAGEPEARLVYLQWVNAVTSAMAPAVFGLLVLRLGSGPITACVFGLMLGLSGSFYFFSSQLEVYGLTTLFACAGLLGMARPTDSRRDRILIAAGYAGAMLFHQTAIFLGLPILLLGLRRRSLDRGDLIGRLVVTLLLPLATVALVYAAIGAYLGHRELGSFWRWVTMHVEYGYWGKGALAPATLMPALRRFQDALLVTPPGMRWWFQVFFGAVTWYVLARVASDGRKALRDPFAMMVHLSWMGVLAGFSTWWDAEGAEFWGMVLVPGFLALSFVAPAAGGRPARAIPNLLAGACLAVALAFALASGATHLRLNARLNEVRQAARVVPQAARDGDLVYAVGTDRSTYYRIYLAGRPVKVLAINVKPARDAGRRSAPETFTSTFIDVIEEEVRAVESLGGRCLIDHWILDGKISTSRLTSGLDRAEFNELLKSRFRIVPIATQPEGQFYELRAGHPDG